MLRTERMRNAVLEVLRQIGERYPVDLQSIQSLVRKIESLSEQSAEDGTVGQWFEDQPQSSKPETWSYGLGDPTPGVIRVWEGDSGEDPRATLAHELGHVCVTSEDLERRGDAPFDEWREELSADWYAYRWGFGDLIAAARATRHHMHHGPSPGRSFACEMPDGQVHAFRVGENFTVEDLGPELPK